MTRKGEDGALERRMSSIALPPRVRQSIYNGGLGRKESGLGKSGSDAVVPIRSQEPTNSGQDIS